MLLSLAAVKVAEGSREKCPGSIYETRDRYRSNWCFALWLIEFKDTMGIFRV